MTPGAIVMVGSVLLTTGWPGASSIGTFTTGISRVRPVILDWSMTRWFRDAQAGAPFEHAVISRSPASTTPR